MTNNLFSFFNASRFLTSISKYMFILMIVFSSVVSLQAQCTSTNTVTESMPSNNGQRGIMFDIVATNDIIINCFSPYLYSGVTGTYCIYYCNGSFVGKDTNAAAWFFVDSVTNITGATNIPTYIPISVNVPIQAGDTVGFYITARGPNSSYGGTYYLNDTSAIGTPHISDANMSVLTGVGKAYPFLQSFIPRAYLGQVHYSLDFSAGQDISTCGNLPVNLNGNDESACLTTIWTTLGSGTFNNPNLSNAIYTPSANDVANGSVSLVYSGCNKSDTMLLSITPIPASPTITASNNNPCAGTQVLLTANIPTGLVGTEYLWSKNGTPINYQNGGTGTYLVNAGNTSGISNYSVQIIYAGNSCLSPSSANTSLNVFAPTATITPTGATTFCANTPTTLNAPAGMAAYVWKRGSTTVGTSASYIPTVSGNHNVTVTDANGCTKTSPIIGISIKSVPPASAGADKALCVGSQTAIGSTGSNLYTYTWSPATGLSNAYIANPTTSSSGTYTLSVNNPANGCSNTDAVVITSLSIPQTPTISATQSGNLITISSNTPGASSVNWYKDGAGLYSNKTPNSSISVQPSNPTKAYTVRSKGENGCLSMPSAAVNVRIGDEKGGDLLISQENVMEVYPNPVTHILNVKLQNSEENEGKLLLYNNMGQLVFAQNISLLNGGANETLDLQHLAAGIYTLTFQTVSSNFVQKVVKD